MLSIEIAVASYKLLVVSVDELYHIYIAEVMGMQRIYNHGKEHSTVVCDTQKLSNEEIVDAAILNCCLWVTPWRMLR
jgi:hypothetical protein